ncbi:3-oxoadipate enol-lactonase [Amycolatopsis arida]|uniref:3-oxoadipate enol-lactonase n=1 Tax=Amycolatopsis arida TaxID=587909 RepID=A0A1I5SQE2_9PSEU|nr:3-oxoadipate enol-lactonase [Amycolatopsis arida]TDX96396.1 3-oxoadipate enol-lactonase [Amycolatopsis arida]SFP72727.1 3-oxoadipate enol-lactonase [Amycolatopsis arida]
MDDRPCAVHHRVDGPAGGEVVVLSNSLGTDLRMWEPQVAPLVAAGFRVVRYDTRGHGRSPVPPGPYGVPALAADVLALLDRLDVPAAHVVGLSLGGMTGMWLAAHAPDRVRRLVLCCTSARPGNAGTWRERAARVRAEGMARVAGESVARWCTAEWRAAHPGLARGLREMAAATPAEGYAACCAALSDVDLTADLGAITAPTLVISAAADHALPPEHGRLVADAVPGARFAVIERAAHLGSYERPEAFTRLITEHLEGS